MSMDYLDKAGALYVVTKTKELAGAKVDKEEGKGLSANDFTNELKTKLDGMEDGATNNVVDETMSATSSNAIANKTVYSELEKKAGVSNPVFIGTPKAPTPAAGTNNEQIATTAFVADAVSAAVGNITGIQFSVVSALPDSGNAGVIYLLANGSGEAQNAYDEYIWTGTAFEKIGTTSVDLSGYVKSTELKPITNAEIDAMFS